MLDTNVYPPAYLITFRTYGTWLHGDADGSIDREHNIYGTPALPANYARMKAEEERLKHVPIVLNASQRGAVDCAIREVCRHRRYVLMALNVRTNHVHVVISAASGPERIPETLKAYATRRLRQENLIADGMKPWSRHGSTPYLWKKVHVEKAVGYVLYGQGDELFEF